MSTSQIRKKFLKYFSERGHTIVPSSPVFPFDDPTLLFINAGMNQFKDVFLGKSQRDYTRASSAQKCIRVGGKHNDLENVGHTSRHLTFFEMLGNFSFGDYFKKEAIQFSWEVSVDVFGLDPDRIWPTVFRDDDEAFELWKQYVPENRITRFEEKQNFWAMGDQGPCGPCSELLYDRGAAYGKAKNPKDDVKEERFLEFWNLVFMQYNRNEKEELLTLPRPSIDTGAGIERIVALQMDVENVFETDVLRGLINEVEEISGIAYRPNDSELAPAFHVIADHMRTLSFSIADGLQPGNVERGYVLRKVLRRAVRYGRMLGLDQPFLAKILPRLITLMGDDYPELKKAKEPISEILTQEEDTFLRTLHRGGNLLSQIVEKAKSQGNQIKGEEAFKLKDTYGLPFEEILLLAKDADLTVDEKKYQVLDEEARERSRQAHQKVSQVAEESLFADFTTTFIGYTDAEAKARIIGLVVDGKPVSEISDGAMGIVILDRTPFYAEMGGQVGDTGVIQGENGFLEVNDCQAPYQGVTAHFGKVEGGLKINDSVFAKVDTKRRQEIENNHTATHLLHWALQKVLGPHANQAGSVVEPTRLRFDFNHHKSLTSSEIKEIESLVNAKIRENLPVKWYEVDYEKVQKDQEIKQFFGEKYGKKVRVIDIQFSKELCGGTHTSMLGRIGFFKITKEGSIAAGIRRMEAVTGFEAEKIVDEQKELLDEIAQVVKAKPGQIKEQIQTLLEENRTLTQKLKLLEKNQAEQLAKTAEKMGSVPVIIKELELSSKNLRPFADEVMKRLKSGVIALAVKEPNKCQVLVMVSDDWIGKGISAKDLIQKISPVIDGGGGGKANSAAAGGKKPENVEEALNMIKESINKCAL